MKVGPVTKLGKRNKTMSKKFDDNVMSTNCDVIVIFHIMANSDAQSVKLMFSLIVTFYLTKTENRTKKSLIYYFQQKVLNFYKKNADISKITGSWY